MKKLKIFIVILIIILILIIGIIGLLVYKTQNKEGNEINNIQIEEIPKIMRVDNASMFFTVESCVNKYITYLSSQDAEIIFNLLDESYKTELEISKQNVLQHVEELNGIYTFSAKDMYYEKNGDIQKYYVTGEIAADGLIEIVSESSSIKFNITVILDMSNNTFTVIPYGYGGIYYEEKYN